MQWEKKAARKIKIRLTSKNSSRMPRKMNNKRPSCLPRNPPSAGDGLTFSRPCIQKLGVQGRLSHTILNRNPGIGNGLRKGWGLIFPNFATGCRDTAVINDTPHLESNRRARARLDGSLGDVSKGTTPSCPTKIIV